MIQSILDAVAKRQQKVGATAVTAETPFPEGTFAYGWTDASVKGNPGQMGVGYIFKDVQSRIPIVYAGGQIGHGTNNEAEYHALILAMRHALRLGIWSVAMYTDSQLLQRQVEGRYKVKQSRLKRLHSEALSLLGLFFSFELLHVPREKNAEADELSRRIMYVEPNLPPLNPPGSKRTRSLYPFQAAAIRWWGLKGRASTGVMQRIFGVSEQLVTQIVEGRTYRDATFALPPLFPPDETRGLTFKGNPIAYQSFLEHGSPLTIQEAL